MFVKLKVCMYPVIINSVFYFALGGVKFVVNVGEAQRFEMNTLNNGIDYTNNQQHEAHLWRTGKDSETLHLQV